MNQPKSVVTVGTFDGVHRGHAEVIKTVVDEANKLGMRPLAITFDRHPLSVVAPERAPRLITDCATRDRLLRALGTEVATIPFTEDVRKLTAAQWMRKMKEDFGAEVVVIGYDNTFGSDGLGLKLTDFERIGEECGLKVILAPMLAGCSSSAVREAIKAGNVGVAADILGRPFEVAGTVAPGRRIGRTIGAPTANLRTAPDALIPGNGVYAAWAHVDDDPKGIKAVVNVGTSPTVNSSGTVTIEAHLLDFHRDIYGKRLRLKFMARIRDEKKFDRISQLRDQIADDARNARTILEFAK